MNDSRRSQDLISIHEGDSVGLEKHERTLRRDRQINQVADRTVTFLDKTIPKKLRRNFVCQYMNTSNVGD